MEAWPLFFKHIAPKVRPYLCEEHLRGLKRLDLDEELPPSPHELRDRVFSETGWELVRAVGEVPAPEFFRLLSERKFPLVHELRPVNSLFASAIPDFWHEVFGHIPLLWSQAMSDIYQELGKAACHAISRDDSARLQTISKLYWYTCEYGLVREEGELKMIGAGLIASPLGSYKLERRAKIRRFTAHGLKRETMNPYQYQGNLFYFESFEKLLPQTQDLFADVVDF